MQFVISHVTSDTSMACDTSDCDLFLFSSRIDTTRVEFTIPLRENWALPFFAVQIATITYLFRPDLTRVKEVSVRETNIAMCGTVLSYFKANS